MRGHSIMYNILIADDESYQRSGMEKIITQLNPEYRVYTASDGRAALDILQKPGYRHRVYRCYNASYEWIAVNRGV